MARALLATDVHDEGVELVLAQLGAAEKDPEVQGELEGQRKQDFLALSNVLKNGEGQHQNVRKFLRDELGNGVSSILAFVAVYPVLACEFLRLEVVLDESREVDLRLALLESEDQIEQAFFLFLHRTAFLAPDDLQQLLPQQFLHLL